MHKLLPDLPSKLESHRVVVRKYAKGDGRHLYGLLQRDNNRELLKEHAEEIKDIDSEKDAEIKVRRHAAEWTARERFVMGIWLKSDNEYIGEIWIEPKKWEVPSFELGYFLDQGHQGKGLATEAARRSIDFIFDDLNAHKMIVITRDNNERSWRLAERLGLVREGHHRECGISDGERWGVFYYGLLRNEFRERMVSKES
ncbi:MAG: GNAT family N-acetyltransferase [Candidatus Thorarchaeota archaeon]